MLDTAEPVVREPLSDLADITPEKLERFIEDQDCRDGRWIGTGRSFQGLILARF